jgi:DNA methylase/ParB-like nuclease domain
MTRSSPGNLAIIYLPISEVRLNRNPRRHSDRQIKEIGRSIQTFGNVIPIVIDQTGTILAGHGRWLASQRLGHSVIPTIRIEHLTKAQGRAFMVADNRLAEMSTWDDELLAETLKELSALNLDFDIEATGFTVGEIDLRIENSEAAASGSNDEPEPPLAAQDVTPISKPGDLWTLGDHRLYCGNALEPATYQTLMHGRRASVGFTDPPYNVRIDGHASGLGKIHHREFAMASGEMNDSEFTAFLTLACSHLARNSVNGAIHFVCTDWRHMGGLLAAGAASFSELLNLCVWCKSNAGMGSFYRSQHELVFVFKAGRGRHRNNVQLGQYGRNRTNVWSYPGANSFGRATDEGHLQALHPTVKPVRLVADAILDCSARGEIVLDPFLGSGTTLIAAERVGRACYGIEIDPLYADTAIRRWQAYSGQSAIHAVKGTPFEEAAKAEGSGRD